MNKTPKDSLELLSSKDAGAILGYTHDYISRLCRHDKMSGIQKGREWYVTQEELEAFKGRHEIELQEKKKELSKKFSKIRLEHEAKKREARLNQTISQPDIEKKSPVINTSSNSTQKAIKFKVPGRLISLAVLILFVFGSTLFDFVSKNITSFQNTANIMQVDPMKVSDITKINPIIDQGIQDTLYEQATAVEPVTTAVMSLSYLTEGFKYFSNSIIELPQAIYVSLFKTGNAYLMLYVVQGKVLYENILNMHRTGLIVLRGYELMGESFYLGSADILSIYSKVLYPNSFIETSQNMVINFTSDVSGGFKYTKETISKSIFKNTISQVTSAFDMFFLNVGSNLYTMQASVVSVSADIGAYSSSIFQFNLIKKDSEMRRIEIKQ